MPKIKSDNLLDEEEEEENDDDSNPFEGADERFCGIENAREIN